jgi:hypothetical protein
MFRTVSQTMLEYHHSPLSEGKAGKIQGGDRLPWVPVKDGDNYESLRTIGWQVHVYGTAHDDLRAWCDERKVPLIAFNRHVEYEKAGLARDAAYLLRPDTYVAFADQQQSPGALTDYVKARGVVWGK